MLTITSIETRSSWVVASISVALLSLSWTNAVFAALAAGLSGFFMARLAMRQIGGQTGDVLGGAEQMSETAILILLAARRAQPGARRPAYG